MNMLTISPIRAFSDNYIWLIVRNNQAFVVDPGEPAPVLAALTEILPRLHSRGYRFVGLEQTVAR